MSISTDAGPFRAHRSSRWGELDRVIGEWWQHLRLRRELESLDHSCYAISAWSRAKSGSRRQGHSG